MADSTEESDRGREGRGLAAGRSAEVKEPAAPRPAEPELADIDLRPYRGAAGGISAVRQSFAHLRRESGALRGARTALRMNQERGFDCPGCAWPEPARRGRIEFCENGAKAVAEETTRRRATPELFAERSIDELRRLSDFELGKLGRLTHPLVLEDGDAHYRRIDWEGAFARIARELGKLASPDEAVFYTSGRTSNEAAFLYQLFARQLGTNNLPDCSNMCHESSGVALSEVIGVGKGTVSLDDFARADAVFVIGQNPGTNHPRMLTTLREAARRGCRIVTINPLREPGLMKFSHPQKLRDLVSGGTTLTSLYLPVRIGGDIALLQGIMKAVVEAEARRPGEVIDRAFIDAYTTGFEALAEQLAAADWEELVRESGVCRDDIERAAAIYTGAERVIACWAMGITQHEHAVATIQEVVNLLLLGGNLGRPGAGACPVRGHSNVQGDRTVGINHKPKRAFLERLGQEFGFEPPQRPGLDTVDAIRAMLDGNVRAFFALGGNFLSATPDTEATARALAGCALTVHVSTKPNRSHLQPGRTSLILPCLGRTEVDRQASGPQFVTVENSMSIVHRSQGQLEPASEALLSEPAIVAGIARAALPAAAAQVWAGLTGDYDRIRDRIARVVGGFDDYNRRVREPGGFRLPNGARERDFSAVGGKARFTVHPRPALDLPDGRFRMMTIRSHDQYNTTIYGLDDRYRGVYGERRVVFLNPADIDAAGLSARQVVDLISEHAGRERIARRFIVVPLEIPRRCAATYFPEANPLVPLESTAQKSNTPTSKSVTIRIEPTGR